MSCNSPLRILSNSLTPRGTLSADSIALSDAVFADRSIAREGNGAVRLLGDYSGSADAVFDVVVTSGAASAPTLSTPIYQGAANQQISDLSLDNTAPAGASYAAILDSLGLDTLTAQVQFDDQTILQAAVAGLLGNSVTISAAAPLLFGAPIGQLAEPWPAGQSSQVGAQWFFDQLPLQPDGQLPPEAAFVRIGNGPRIYRTYQQVAPEGGIEYVLDPPPDVDLPAGATVTPLTAGVTVTTTDGVTTRMYPNIRTRYDLYAALRDDTQRHIAPPAVVADDRTPGAQGALPLNIITFPYVSSIIGAGSRGVTERSLEDVSVDAGVATQTLLLECIGEAGDVDAEGQLVQINNELWRVSSPLFGEVQVRTGQAVSQGGYNFTIPPIKRPAGDTGAKVSGSISLTARTEGEASPSICVKNLRAGARAINETVTFTYMPVPAAACGDCTNTPPNQRIDPTCLGLDDIEGVADMAVDDLDPEFQSRLDTLSTFRVAGNRSNTALVGGGNVRAAIYDLQVYDTVYREFGQALAAVWPSPAGRTEYDARFAEMVLDLANLTGLVDEGGITRFSPQDAVPVLGDVRIPPVSDDNGHFYLVVLISSAAGLPTQSNDWPTDGSLLQLGVRDGPTGSSNTSIVLRDLGPRFPGGGGGTDIGGDEADGGQSRNVNDFLSRYVAAAQRIKDAAGLHPFEGADSLGTDCWREKVDAQFHWVVDGKDSIAPAYTNEQYYSHEFRQSESGQRVAYNTHRYGFYIQVPPDCEGLLKEGDQVKVEITNAGEIIAYFKSDSWKLLTIGAKPLALAGGRDGNDEHTWRIERNGALLANYVTPATGTPPLFNNSGLTLRINRGTLAAKAGDQFTFLDERGRYQILRDNIVVAGPLDIADPPPTISGLTPAFDAARAPNWIENDVYRFHVKQPANPQNAESPNERRYKSSAGIWTLTRDHGVATDISFVVIGPHNIPESATLAIHTGATAGVTEFSEPIAWREQWIIHVISTAQVAQFAWLRVTGAMGASVQWFYAGPGWQPDVGVSGLSLTDFAEMDGEVSRINTGFGVGANLLLRKAFEVDHTGLRNLYKHAKRNDDEPVALIPSIVRPEFAELMLMPDDLPRLEKNNHQRLDSTKLEYEMRVNFDAYIPPRFL